MMSESTDYQPIEPPPVPQPPDVPELTPEDVSRVEEMMDRSESDRLKRRLEDLAAAHRGALQEIDELREQIQRTRRPPIMPALEEIDAELTGFHPTSGTPYKWRQVALTSAGVQFLISGAICSSISAPEAAVEANGWRFLASGQRVRLKPYTDDIGMRFLFVAPVPAPVNPNVNQVLGYSSATRQMAWLEQYTCSA